MIVRSRWRTLSIDCGWGGTDLEMGVHSIVNNPSGNLGQVSKTMKAVILQFFELTVRVKDVSRRSNATYGTH